MASESNSSVEDNLVMFIYIKNIYCYRGEATIPTNPRKQW